MLESILDLLKYRFGRVIPVVKILFALPSQYKFKNLHTNRIRIMTLIVSSKYWQLYQFCNVKIFGINQN